VLDPNIVVDLKPEIGANFKNFNCTIWMPYEISTAEYQNFEENVIKEQKVLCTQDEQYPRDKCVSIRKPIFENGPKIQVIFFVILEIFLQKIFLERNCDFIRYNKILF